MDFVLIFEFWFDLSQTVFAKTDYFARLYTKVLLA